MRQIISLLFLCCTALLEGCVKDKPNPPATKLPGAGAARVLVVCEGSLGNGNSELSVYLPDKDSVYQSVFKQANGQALGDVFQSATRINDVYWLCVNNSDRITVIDPVSWRQKATVSVPRPRYCYAANSQKAYVGSLFSNKLYVVNTQSYTVQKEIVMPYQNVEGIFVKDNIAWVCCWDTACTKLYAVNTLTDQLTDSISLAGAAPQNLLMDKENKLWVLGGNAYKDKSSSLSRIDLSSKNLVRSYIFDKGIEAIKPVFNPTKDTLYFLEVDYSGGTLNNGVYRMPVSSSTLPGQAFIACSANQYFWALGIDPVSGDIYVGDPKGFVQKGSVSVYTAKGLILHQFTTDLGVGSFYFD